MGQHRKRCTKNGTLKQVREEPQGFSGCFLPVSFWSGACPAVVKTARFGQPAKNRRRFIHTATGLAPDSFTWVYQKIAKTLCGRLEVGT